ncbi:MAG: DUF721 domain-containing protein [Magnetovibrio sp.]|nr:DUF721 domain-containing protein [Magnetovibrio sp.]
MAKKTTPKPVGIIPSDRRGRSPRALSQTINRLTKSMLGRHGLVRGTLLTKWHDVVGEKLSSHTSPEKIVFARDGKSGGILHLRCDSGAFATQVQHQELQILERINTFFGYKAIVRIKLIQAPLGRKRMPRVKPPIPLSSHQAQKLSETVASVEDDELRAALERLGASILRRT